MKVLYDMIRHDDQRNPIRSSISINSQPHHPSNNASLPACLLACSQNEKCPTPCYISENIEISQLSTEKEKEKGEREVLGKPDRLVIPRDSHAIKPPTALHLHLPCLSHLLTILVEPALGLVDQILPSRFFLLTFQVQSLNEAYLG